MTNDPMGAPRPSNPPVHPLELGVASGVAAGLVYLIAACILARVGGGHADSPLRLPAAVVFGPAALGSFFPIWRAALAGVGVNLAVSAALGIAWVVALNRTRVLRSG